MKDFILNYDIINFIGNNSMHKKNLFNLFEKNLKINFYFLKSNSNIADLYYYYPFIIFLIQYFDLGNNDSKKIMEKKIRTKIKDSLRKKEVDNLILILNIFYGINKFDNLDSFQNFNSLLFNFSILLKKIFEYISNNQKLFLIFDEFDNYDKWTKNFIINNLFELNKPTFKLIIYSSSKIKNNKIERYEIIDKENNKIQFGYNNDIIPYIVTNGDICHIDLLKNFLKIDKNKLKPYIDKNIIYLKNKFLYFLSSKIRQKILDSLNYTQHENAINKLFNYYIKSETNDFGYHVYLFYLVNNLRDKNKKIKYLKILINYFEKINSREHLLKVTTKLLRLDDQKEYVIKAIKLYKYLSKYEEGIIFIDTYKNKFSDNPFFRNTLSMYEAHFKRYVGKYQNLKDFIKKGARVALINNFYNNYSFWMGELCFLYYLEGDINKASETLSKIYDIKDNVDKDYLISNYYLMQSLINEFTKSQKKVLDSYIKIFDMINSSKNNSESVDPKVKLSVFNNYADFLLMEEKYSQSIKEFNDALNLAEEVYSLQDIAIYKYNLSHIYLRLENLKKGKKYYTESLNISKIINTKRFIGLNYLSKSIYLLKSNSLNDALLTLLHVKNIAEKIKNSYLNSLYLLNTGKIYFLKDNISKALYYLKKGYQISENNNDSRRFYYLPYLIKSYKKKGNINKVNELLKTGLALTENRYKYSWFYIKLQQIKLLKNKDKKIKELLSLKNKKLYSFQKGEIFYNLFNLTQKEKFKNKSINLIKKYSSYKYKQMLKDFK
ncbi:MAG TPA: tetratricopeptide repeat protein [Candidatus Mcinerneyibacterium sp.]|nr:tetratricopeptide repeat protein [Candidatus Mcinerneyibacterium sp.]